MTTCSYCGGTLKPLSKFCSQCGAKVDNFSNIKGACSVESGTKPLQVSPSARVAIGSTLFVVPSHFVVELTKLLDEHIASPLALVADTDAVQLQIKARSAVKRHISSGALKYVCLLGNWSEVPPFRVRNPSPYCLSSDPFCLTDSLYGCTEEYDEDNIFTSIPNVPVGRIPVLDVAVVASSLMEAPRLMDPAQAFAFGVTAESWSIPTRAIVRLFTDSVAKANLVNEPQIGVMAAPGVLTSPGWGACDLRNAVSQTNMDLGSVLLFNVHGMPDETSWYGDDGMIMMPDTILQFNSALLISEACYGGALGYKEPSIVENFFTNGGKAFVGSSVISWGSTNDGWLGDDGLQGADLIALHFLKALRQGKSLGESLTHAKLAALQFDDPFNPFNYLVGQKTALSFNLFGAPWHSLKTAHAASVIPLRENKGSILDRLRSRRGRDGEDPSDSLDALRQRYQSRLPESSQRFMVESNEALRRINNFQDFHKIEIFLTKLGVNIEDCELEALKIGDDIGYLLFGKSNKRSDAKQLFQLVTDSVGAVKNIITSKG